MSVTVAMTYARALRIAHSPGRASDIELSLAYDSLEEYELVREANDYLTDGSDIDMSPSTSQALNALDVEMYDRERYFPTCSRAGMREATR